MSDKDKNEEVVCEFFGIKITTSNPNVARVLTSDVGELMSLDVREVKTFMVNDQADDDIDDTAQNRAESVGLDTEPASPESPSLDVEELIRRFNEED